MRDSQGSRRDVEADSRYCFWVRARSSHLERGAPYARTRGRDSSRGNAILSADDSRERKTLATGSPRSRARRRTLPGVVGLRVRAVSGNSPSTASERFRASSGSQPRAAAPNHSGPPLAHFTAGYNSTGRRELRGGAGRWRADRRRRYRASCSVTDVVDRPTCPSGRVGVVYVGVALV